MRRRLATLAAALGATCLVLVALAPFAHAGTPTLTIYQAGGTGSALSARFTIRPSIFDPLLEGGALRTYTSLTSQAGGTGNALTATIFPGTLVVGGAKGTVGCSGLPGSPWVEGNFPSSANCPATQESRLYQTERSHFGADHGQPAADDVPNAVLDRSSVRAGYTVAHADAHRVESDIAIGNYTFSQDVGQPALLQIDQITLTNIVSLGDTVVSHESLVQMHGISLLNGEVTIGTLISKARTTSDGVAPTAYASMTFSDVQAQVAGGMHRATIDESGIHVNDPALDPNQNLQLTEDLDEGLTQAHVLIAAAAPTRITDGASQASASDGGLLIAFGAQIPFVAIPPQIAPYLARVIDEVPPFCASSVGAPLPVCTGGSGILPGPGSQFPLQFNLAAVQSNVVGTGFTEPTFGGGPPPCLTCGGGIQPPSVLGTQFSNGSGGTPQAPQVAAPSAPAPGQMFGLAARLPSSALAIAGAAFLILAVGLMMGPSLRDASAG